MPRSVHMLAAMMLTTTVMAGVARAQADYTQSFESLAGLPSGSLPQPLINAGWVFRNQSSPVDGPSYESGDGFGGEPFDGQGYLKTSGMSTDFFGGAVSNWAILPPIAGQQTGDLFTVWISGGGAFSNDTFFDIRYAPSGDGTGSGPDDVGDFTQVLFSAELPIAELGYQRISVQVPGPGRLAMRFHAPFIRHFAGGGAFLSIDTLSVGPEGDDPCGVPIPDPGQTVVWSAAQSPITICQDLLIPSAGRVEVEPGVSIDLSGGTLRVEGELEAIGTDALPISLTGQHGSSAGLSVAAGGSAEIDHATIDTTLSVSGTDSALVISNAQLQSVTRIGGAGGFLGVDHCVFDAGSIGTFSAFAGTLRLTDTQFINGAFAAVGGILHIDNISIDGNVLSIQSESTAQPVLLDNISVTNNSSGPGVSMYGPNFLLGDNITLQNNLYPLQMSFTGAGLLPGSTLPSTGNINNYIPVEQLGFGPRRAWADTGIPYVVGEFPAIYGGTLTVEPGTNIRFLPDAGAFIVGSATLNLRGTRDKPIVLESFNSSQRWFGLKWVDDFDARARHTVFDGGQISVQSDGGVMDLIHSTVRDSLEGTASVTGGIVRLFGTEIVDNQTGMVTTSSGRIEADGFVTPSIFEGNAVAVEYNNTNSIPFMRNNWWGDPTGPTTPLHPEGMGDTVINVHPAGFTPYLTEPPVLDDEFPIVEMEPIYFTMRAGEKTILRWSSSDDHEIVEQRVEFADHDFPSEFETIAVLDADANTYEFTAPEVLPTNLYPTPAAIRIVAVDSAGQESWDKTLLRVPYQQDWTVVPQDIAPIAPVVRPHENIDVCWSPTGFGDAYVLIDGYGISDSAGGTTAGCLPIGATLPYVSTDTARIVVITTFGAGGRLNYSFSDYFSIRPDERLGDEPPMIEVTSPDTGDHFFSEGVIPVRWDASDDESLRSFSIQASYDGGRTWPSVVRDLPGDARAFDWRLPVSSGIDDVRVRVIAVDHRFQDSSSATGALSILAANPCAADLNGDGNLDFFDVSAFLNAFNAADPSVDFTADGNLDFFDVSAFLAAFSAGCP